MAGNSQWFLSHITFVVNARGKGIFSNSMVRPAQGFNLDRRAR